MAKAYLKEKEKFLWALFSGYILNGLNYAQGQTDSNAFITFETRETVMKAIHKLNNTKLDDFPIRFSQDDDETGRILIEGKTYVVAQNFDPGIEFSQIHDALPAFEIFYRAKLLQSNVKGKYMHIWFIKISSMQATEDLKDVLIN